MAAQPVALVVACEVQPGLFPKGNRPPLVAPRFGVEVARCCADHSSCKERVFEAGEEWPLVESEPTDV